MKTLALMRIIQTIALTLPEARDDAVQQTAIETTVHADAAITAENRLTGIGRTDPDPELVLAAAAAEHRLGVRQA
jgi:hypothetical protein